MLLRSSEEREQKTANVRCLLFQNNRKGIGQEKMRRTEDPGKDEERENEKNGKQSVLHFRKKKNCSLTEALCTPGR